MIQLDSMLDAAQYVYANVAKYLFWGVVQIILMRFQVTFMLNMVIDYIVSFVSIRHYISNFSTDDLPQRRYKI